MSRIKIMTCTNFIWLHLNYLGNNSLPTLSNAIMWIGYAHSDTTASLFKLNRQ